MKDGDSSDEDGGGMESNDAANEVNADGLPPAHGCIWSGDDRPGVATR